MKADRRYTYRDYRTWPDDERWELMDGTAYAMSPAPRREHQGLAGLIYRSIMEHLITSDHCPGLRVRTALSCRNFASHWEARDFVVAKTQKSAR